MDVVPELDAAELIARMEAGFQQARQQVQARQRFTMTEEVGHGLGKVVANGYGQLLSIVVDREAFHSVNEDVLARRIVEAVNRVEDRTEELLAEGKGEFR